MGSNEINYTYCLIAGNYARCHGDSAATLDIKATSLSIETLEKSFVKWKKYFYLHPINWFREKKMRLEEKIFLLTPYKVVA